MESKAVFFFVAHCQLVFLEGENPPVRFRCLLHWEFFIEMMVGDPKTIHPFCTSNPQPNIRTSKKSLEADFFSSWIFLKVHKR